jgi:hypothetical protein
MYPSYKISNWHHPILTSPPIDATQSAPMGALRNRRIVGIKPLSCLRHYQKFLGLSLQKSKEISMEFTLERMV